MRRKLHGTCSLAPTARNEMTPIIGYSGKRSKAKRPVLREERGAANVKRSISRVNMVNFSSEFRYNWVTNGTFCGDLASLDAE